LHWDKVVFGTDSLPNDGHIPYGDLIRLMAALDLPGDAQRGILGGTAARIFGLSETKGEVT